MAATLVNLSGFQRGCEAAETGINLESFDVDSKPEYKDLMHNYLGEVIGFAAGPVMAEISISGEVTNTTGIMAVAIGTALVPTNDVDQFGQTAGGCYPDSFTQTQSRDGFRKISVKLSRYAGCT